MTILSIGPLHAQIWEFRQSGLSDHLRGIDFVNTSVGIVVGNFGSLARTTDGGDTWTPVLSGTTENLRAVAMYRSGKGFVVGANGTILSTSNGGATWFAQQSGSSAYLLSVACFDSMNALAVGNNGTILRTSNGGNTWSVRNSGTFSGLFSVAYSSKTNAVAVGNFGRIVRTTDGGLTWNAVPNITSLFLNSICFFDQANGIIVTEGYVCFRTTNGGKDWVSQQIGSRFASVVAYDASHASAVGSSFANTDNGGVSWNPGYVPVYLHAAQYRDSSALFTVGQDGVIALLSSGTGSPLPPVLVFPGNNAENVPVLISESQQRAISILWNKYYDYFASSFHVQISHDSTFSSELFFDDTLITAPFNDTGLVVQHFFPKKKYYCRVRASFGPVKSPWSDVHGFTVTADHYARTVRQIQTIGLDSLHIADSLQDAVSSRWMLQRSPLYDSVAFLVGVCVVPIKDVRNFTVLGISEPAWFIVADTGIDGTQWNGLKVILPTLNDWTVLDMNAGDVVMLTGKIIESPGDNMNSETVFYSYSISVIDSQYSLPHPLKAGASDFYAGMSPTGKVRYSTGELYEGMMVELSDLSVHSYDNFSAGTLRLIDGDGNAIFTNDDSQWFTMRDHRLPSSTYTLPPLGTRIDTLRGIVRAFAAAGSVPGSYRIMPVQDGDIVYGDQRSGVLEGFMFNDFDRDGSWDQNEPPIPNWRVTISGKIGTSLLTDSMGRFFISGIDSGLYIITAVSKGGWVQSFPGSNGSTIQLGYNSTSSGNNFGVYYLWSTISGTVYHDLNENGIRDNSEPGLENWGVQINGMLSDSVLTDSNGEYVFRYLTPGNFYVNLMMFPSWEQSLPTYLQGFVVDFQAYDQHRSNYNFGVHPVKERVKLTLSVYNNFNQQIIKFGVRPGTTYGIWGADPQCTYFDYSEGESELPPQYYGIFDVRFVDPRNSIDQFGQGGWIDMREFVYPTQVDTYKIKLAPGYIFGGNYPMTICWSRDSIAHHYSGSVTLHDGRGVSLDMKAHDSLVVTDNTITSLLLIARQPNISKAWSCLWNLVSLPVYTDDRSARTIFPSSVFQAYSFEGGKNYKAHDTLTPGTGYWLKYRYASDVLSFDHTARLHDTIEVGTGWNLIGALSRPVSTNSVVTDPPNIILGGFYGYDEMYFPVDSMLPGRGYWVNAALPGTLILDAAASNQKTLTNTITDFYGALEKAGRLHIRDANANTNVLYFSLKNEVDIRQFGLPPLPPVGVFDARFASHRLLETIEKGETGEFPLLISSAEYPLTISWDMPSIALRASLVVAGKETELSENGSISVHEALVNSTGHGRPAIAVKLLDGTSVPQNFTLEQNYPNPFNPRTVIRYQLPFANSVTVTVYDVLGREIAMLIDEKQEAGYKSVEWDASRFPSGVYFYRIESGTFIETKKMLLMK